MNTDPNQDYYGTLGVTPFAELVVIKAAYKALASIYHPDKNSSDGAAQKIREINEAWEVLSDPDRRREYDEQRHGVNQENNIFGDVEREAAGATLFGEDWDLALLYYPDLKELGDRLERISWRLSIAFKAHLLQEKNFKERENIAKEMERQFLVTYFGKNDQILRMAKHLIFVNPNKKLLRELNTAVTTLGISDPAAIIERFKRDLPDYWGRDANNIPFERLKELFKSKGYHLEMSFWTDGYKVTTPSGETIRLHRRYDLNELYYKDIMRDPTSS
jgi:curved DNA-binding protein CbpA